MQDSMSHLELGWGMAHRHLSKDPSEDYLAGFGRKWNFDIFQLYNESKKDLSIVANRLIEKFDFDRLLHFPSSVAHTFFSNLE
jgi:hypothetical protein